MLRHMNTGRGKSLPKTNTDGVNRVLARDLVWIVVLSFLTTSCAARQRGPDEPASGDVWLRAVKLKGVETLDGDSIKEGLACQPPSGWIIPKRTRLDRALIDRDRDRIVTYYQKKGFFDVAVTHINVQKVDKSSSNLTFHIREGDRSSIADIAIKGAPPELTKEHVSSLDVAVGQPFDHDSYTMAITTILARLLESGYAHATVDGSAEADRRKRQVTLRYTVKPGPRVRFGKIVVRGLKIIPESAVRNRLTIASGDLFHPREITASQKSIRELGRFGVVRIDFVDQSVNQNTNTNSTTKAEVTGDIAVTVTEAPRHEVRLGGGLGIDRNNFEVRGRAGYTLHGVFDPLLSFSAELRPAYSIVRANTAQREFVGEARTSLTREDLIWPLARGRAVLTYRSDVLEPYSSRGGNVFLGLSKPFWGRRIHLGVGWRLELLEFTRIDDTIDAALRESLGLETPYRAGFLDQSIALDLRDSPLNARKGLYAELRLEEGGSFAGGKFGYGRMNPEIRVYYPLLDRFGVATRVKLGWKLWGEIPITRRYFSGGSTTHRGFSQRRLSPVAGDIETSDIGIGGDKLVELMIETRMRIVKIAGEWFGVVLFADGGDVAVEGESIDYGNLHWAAGIGLRYNTAIGPIRFDMGYRFNRVGSQEIQSGDRFSFHVSIGEAF